MHSGLRSLYVGLCRGIYQMLFKRELTLRRQSDRNPQADPQPGGISVLAAVDSECRVITGKRSRYAFRTVTAITRPAGQLLDLRAWRGEPEETMRLERR
jgi:hypothetical protein